jgi:hypothetical protein
LAKDAGVGTDWNVTSGDCMGYNKFVLVNPKNYYAQEKEKIGNKNFI